MTENQKEMFTEVYEMIQNLDENQKGLIPKQLLNYIESNRSDTYKFSINQLVSLDEQKLKKESWEFLGMLCLEYLCDYEEKKDFYKELQINENNYQEELRNKFNMNLFEEQDKGEKIKVETTNALVERKTETWYQKWFSLVKNFFRKRKK